MVYLLSTQYKYLFCFRTSIIKKVFTRYRSQAASLKSLFLGLFTKIPSATLLRFYIYLNISRFYRRQIFVTPLRTGWSIVLNNTSISVILSHHNNIPICLTVYRISSLRSLYLDYIFVYGILYYSITQSYNLFSPDTVYPQTSLLYSTSEEVWDILLLEVYQNLQLSF